MMLLLVLALMCQPDDMPETGLNLVADLEFVMATEDFTSQGHKLPKEISDLLTQMDNNSYICRDAATAKLKKIVASTGRNQYLFWGRKHASLEVRIRCNRLLRELNLCPSCKGSGKNKRDETDPCWNCQGLGSIWAHSAFY